MNMMNIQYLTEQRQVWYFYWKKRDK